jgi:mono/diheme cytochrome c family protein
MLGAPLGVRAEHITREQAQLVDEGFRIFTEETFGGNGRKCSTCHLPEANYSISPTEIAAMSEEDRALVLASNVPGLEASSLVDELALFDTKGGVSDRESAKNEFRTSMTIAALDLTVRNGRPSFPGPFGPQLGWAGNASPRDGINHGNADPAADGSIRAFTNGAIAQHSTKRLERVAGVDFRFATDAELDALDAFQRWLGRRPTPTGRNEYDLAGLTFSDARIEQGKAVYMSPQATCNVCHTDGGANFRGSIVGDAGGNVNLNTGVESERPRLSAQTGICIPEDEGGQFTPPPGVPNSGDAFNLQSIIEAPRKRSFFHNGAFASDIEDAVTFYFTDSFLDSPTNIPAADGPGHCTSVDCLDQITPQALAKLGAFMRGLSAFYSLLDCERLLEESIDRIELGVSVDVPLRHCVFALRDVSYVLDGSHVSPTPLAGIATGVSKLTLALEAASGSKRMWRADKLSRVLEVVRSMRRAVATTDELP